MKKTVPEFEAVGSVPDSAISALARLLVHAADRELAGDDPELEKVKCPRDHAKRTAEELETPQRL